MLNRNVWRRERVVREYDRYRDLQEPERVLLEQLRPQLPEMRMLDLGVGAGRTTAYFSELAGEYLGIDYSEEMIRACKQRFPEVDHRGGFAVGDAKLMPNIKDGYYDFILFSYNGIDYLTHEDRVRALREIRRVGKPGGYFFFSTHNLNSDISVCFRVKLTLNPLKMAYRMWRVMALWALNWNLFWRSWKASHLVIRDGTHGFALKTYYIRPLEQIKQLTELSFWDIKVFSANTGSELHGNFALEGAEDSWLYYLCRI
jgi:ubiquinone/menaquinone biosynthesis C-methylase UbiE